MALDQEPECNELLKMLISGDERTSDIRTLLRHHQAALILPSSTVLASGASYDQVELLKKHVSYRAGRRHVNTDGVCFLLKPVQHREVLCVTGVVECPEQESLPGSLLDCLEDGSLFSVSDERTIYVEVVGKQQWDIDTYPTSVVCIEGYLPPRDQVVAISGSGESAVNDGKDELDESGGPREGSRKKRARTSSQHRRSQSSAAVEMRAEATEPSEHDHGAENGGTRTRRAVSEATSAQKGLEVTGKKENGKTGKSKKKGQSFFVRMMNRSEASDLAKSLKRFGMGFCQRPPPISSQPEVVRAFLDTTFEAIELHNAWKGCTEEEMEEMNEGLEKYVMSKIYSKVMAADPEDRRRDASVSDRIRKLSFITCDHLEIGKARQHEPSIQRACTELQKINAYKVPRDKLICILNSCKVIYNLLNATGSGPAGADDFLPLLIYVVLKAAPPFLVSNIEYIRRFRNPEKMMTEPGYYCTQLESAVHFIETCDATMLAIDPEDYERALVTAEASVPAVKRVKVPARSITAFPTDPSALTRTVTPMHAVRAAASEVSLARPIPSRSGSSGGSRFSSAAASDRSPMASKYPFYQRTVETLTIADVSELLREYKRLALEHHSLERYRLAHMKRGGDVKIEALSPEEEVDLFSDAESISSTGSTPPE